jgi:hypothetical protein
MATITFDTLKLVETLKAHGVSEEQAKGIAEAFKNVQGEADIATKRDIDDLRREMREIELRLTIKLGSFTMLATGILIADIKL